MWTVSSEYHDRVPTYFVVNLKTGERKSGFFDAERAAKAFVDYLNDKDAKEKNDKGRKA